MADANAEIRKLIRDFEKLSPALRKELRPALRRGAQPILDEARRRASWSTRIPQATRISTSFVGRRAGISIITSRKKAPHGRPYENLGDRGTIRHPVFGDRDVWVTQAARPFLFDSVQDKGEAVTKELGALVVQIGRKHGWNR